jgi:hypothetical protein
VRGHAAWALGKIHHDDAIKALKSAKSTEKDPFVKNEILAALRE